MKLYAVIVAGGSGKRMGTVIPKQFIELSGKPVLIHTIERFITYSDSIEIITVLPEDHIKFWSGLLERYSFTFPQTLVTGGRSRFFSVRNGLEYVDDHGLVAIHDGVRPLVSIETIRRCFETAGKLGNAIPVISSSDTLRMVTETGNEPINRLNIKQVQTPQVFNAGIIKKAYQQDYRPEFTDDATVLEKTGEKINMVEGNRENIKVTNPEDLVIARSLYSLIDG